MAGRGVGKWQNTSMEHGGPGFALKEGRKEEMKDGREDVRKVHRPWNRAGRVR